ncbi:uncharacterized protein LOC134341733 isoform X2 [Mobula hypostoma]|uniref:uncharacterized protein LOC134341733 isoform X2 n=1 Tax=Mobula hypostoma TaxID=723540 RepID=UPI002FC37D3B
MRHLYQLGECSSICYTQSPSLLSPLTLSTARHSPQPPFSVSPVECKPHQEDLSAISRRWTGLIICQIHWKISHEGGRHLSAPPGATRDGPAGTGARPGAGPDRPAVIRPAASANDDGGRGRERCGAVRRRSCPRRRRTGNTPLASGNRKMERRARGRLAQRCCTEFNLLTVPISPFPAQPNSLTGSETPLPHRICTPWPNMPATHRSMWNK